jgi:16S rRNA U516 pseudouridylate synthase RsuA-like enzyme
MRLQKYIARCGVCSRRDAELLISKVRCLEIYLTQQGKSESGWGCRYYTGAQSIE